MIKEQLTVRVKQSIKTSLLKRAEEKNYKNLNDYISVILDNHVSNIKEESQLLKIVKDNAEDIENIKTALEKLIDIVLQGK